jgi:hypothetical protein
MNFPEQMVSVTDDQLIKTYLVELGISNQVLDGAPLPGDVLNRFLMWVYHPTHWLLFCSFRGHRITEENGLLMVGWPKSKTPLEMFSKEADEFAKELSPDAKTRFLEIDESRT